MKKTIGFVLAGLIIVGGFLYWGFKKNIDAQKMQVYNTPHFSIYYEALNPKTLKDIEQKLESNFTAVNNFFRLDEKSKQAVIVYESVEQFHHAYLGVILSFAYDDWAAAAAYQDLVLITSPENPGSQHTYADILDMIVHEYVHTRVYQLNESADIWLDEGLATFLAGQKGELPRSPVPTYEQLQSQEQKTFVENQGYAWSPAYVEYLINTYGPNKVVELVKTNDYEACLGESNQEVYNKWVAYLGVGSNDG
jgi:hypothetical protein